MCKQLMWQSAWTELFVIHVHVHVIFNCFLMTNYTSHILQRKSFLKTVNILMMHCFQPSRFLWSWSWKKPLHVPLITLEMAQRRPHFFSIAPSWWKTQISALCVFLFLACEKTSFSLYFLLTFTNSSAWTYCTCS